MTRSRLVVPLQAAVSVALGGALVSIGALGAACGQEPDAPLSPSDASPALDTSAPDVGPGDATPTPAIEAFCEETLGLHAPRYAACCDADDAPKQYHFDH